MAKLNEKFTRVPYFTNFSIDLIHNSDTLNIFSDASMRSIGNRKLATCYGSVAVNKDNIIDEVFRLQSVSTVPAAEIRGIRCSLSLALKYRYMYKNINIFSDSQIALFGLRDYIYKWKYNPNDGLLYNGLNSPVKNQELYIETFFMLMELEKTNNVCLYHQNGHVDSNVEALRKSLDVFKNSNNIHGKIDYNVARYISLYNNYVDNKSRSIVRRTNVFENDFHDLISFHPMSGLPTYVNS